MFKDARSTMIVSLLLFHIDVVLLMVVVLLLLLCVCICYHEMKEIEILEDVMSIHTHTTTNNILTSPNATMMAIGLS